MLLRLLASYGRKHYDISHDYKTDSRHVQMAGTSRLLKLSLDISPTLVAFYSEELADLHRVREALGTLL